MAFTTTTQQLLLLSAALLAAPCAGGILTETSSLKPFGLGVSEEAFHAAIAEEDCDAPALNLLHHKATYVVKAKKETVHVSDSKPQSESSDRKLKLPFFSQKTPKVEEGMVLLQAPKSEVQSGASARNLKLPFFSRKTPKVEDGAVLIQETKHNAPSMGSVRNLKLPFFSQKTPKVKEGMVLIEESQSEVRSKGSARNLKLPFFSQKTPKVEDAGNAEVVPEDVLAAAFEEEKDDAVALFQTDMHYKTANGQAAHMSSLTVNSDGSVGAAGDSGHATMPGGKMVMTFGADGSVY